MPDSSTELASILTQRPQVEIIRFASVNAQPVMASWLSIQASIKRGKPLACGGKQLSERINFADIEESDRHIYMHSSMCDMALKQVCAYLSVLKNKRWIKPLIPVFTYTFHLQSLFISFLSPPPTLCILNTKWRVSNEVPNTTVN